MAKIKLNKGLIFGVSALVIAIIVAIIIIAVSGGHSDQVSEEAPAEEAPKVAEKTCTEKALGSDFSCYAGTYTYTSNGYSDTITFTADGVFTDGFGLAQAENYRNDGKPTKVENNNGVLVLTYTYYWSDEAWLGAGEQDFEYHLIPEGVEYETNDYDQKGNLITKGTDTTQTRMIDRNKDGVMVLPIYYKD